MKKCLFLFCVINITVLNVSLAQDPAQGPVEVIEFCGQKIPVNADTVACYEGEFSDISSLSALKNLKMLYLMSTNVTDLTPIAGLTTITNLSLFGSQIADISPIASLANLHDLDLSLTKVKDLSALASLKKLSNLHLNQTDVVDLSPLSGLTHLYWLNLQGSKVKDLTAISGCTSLYSLILNDTDIVDISPLFSLKDLHGLDIENTKISQDQIDEMKKRHPNPILLSIQTSKPTPPRKLETEEDRALDALRVKAQSEQDRKYIERKKFYLKTLVLSKEDLDKELAAYCRQLVADAKSLFEQEEAYAAKNPGKKLPEYIDILGETVREDARFLEITIDYLGPDNVTRQKRMEECFAN